MDDHLKPSLRNAPTESPEALEQTDSRTLTEVKRVTQELLRFGFIAEQRKPDLFRRTISYAREITAALEPLDFALRLDEHRGIAFLVVAETAYEPSHEDTVWAHPLVRRQRLTLEQSLLVAILRKAFVIHEQEAGIGGSPARVAVEELLPEFLAYLGDSGSDAKNESRLTGLLDQLKSHGIVSEVDKNDEVVISPLIAHLADPESLGALLRVFQKQVDGDAANAR